MQELEDIALLREYLERDSEEAFATLVMRHVNKVYSVALRQTGNPHSAEEITQAVFVLLARKARRLGGRVILSGWLYQTARLTAVTFVRGAIRRGRREQEAHMQTIVNKNESEVWPEIAPLLDTAMAGLNETDRHAVVLRYFDGKSLKEVGAALGSNEEAAKKRVSRALEKLRIFFAKHGVHSTTPIIAGAISANSVQTAPVALAKSVSAAALAKGASAASSSTTLIQETLKLMAWTKLKIVALAGVGILLASGTAFVAVKNARPAKLDAADTQKMWDQYAQAMAISGPTADGAIQAAVQVMTNHPPMASIRVSQRRPMPPGQRGGGRAGGIGGAGTTEGHIRMGAFLGEVLRYAYSFDPTFPQNRIIVPLELQAERYDYVDTMPQGGKEVLQRALKDQFGIVARQ
ncbi:MAG: RNA polymerase sigma factor [Limisphaerales bacterium]